MQKQLIPLLQQNIRNFTTTQDKVRALVKNAPVGIIELVRTQFYELCKPELTNLLLKHPIISFEVSKGSNYFISQIEFDPSGHYCIAVKKHIDYEWVEKQIEVYTLPNFNLKTTLAIHCDHVRFSPHGKFLST